MGRALRGNVRVDDVHRKLTAFGFEGSERTRRAVARARRAYAAGNQRITRPGFPSRACGCSSTRPLAPMDRLPDAVVVRPAGLKPLPSRDSHLGGSVFG